MRITKIDACREEIRLAVDGYKGNVCRVRAELPVVYARHPEIRGRVLLEEDVIVTDGCLRLPRKAQEVDLSTARFTVCGEDGEILPGVRFVTDFDRDYAKSDIPFPKVDKPVGTWLLASDEDMDFCGFGFMMHEIDQAWMVTFTPGPDDIPWEYNGKTYWMNRWYAEFNDRLFERMSRRGVPCLLRFINRRLYRTIESPPDVFAVVRHPDYEHTERFERTSAFNITNDEAEQIYEACLDFLFARYADPESPHYAVCMADIGNEVNMEQTYYNCGALPCADMVEEYAEVLRLAWQIARRYNASFRVNVSLEPDFAGNPLGDPEHFYPARDVLIYLEAVCRRDGDVEWGIAEHPYPENLTCPDFWNDRSAPFDFSAYKITMRNLELWPLFVTHPFFLYKGRLRKLIFDEQGFHTDDRHPWKEEQGAYGFVLLWEKLKRQPLIDLFLINRDADLPDEEEEGLHLGLRRSSGFADEEHIFLLQGPRKMICSAIRAANTPEWDAWRRAARAYIGPDIFDHLLDPVLPPIDSLTEVLEKYDLSPYGICWEDER